jgi:rhodanese-related sulfurtransferase
MPIPSFPIFKKSKKNFMQTFIKISLSLFLMVSCAQSTTPVIETVNQATFKQLLLQDLPLLDVRTPREYASGHIAKAVNIDYNALDFEAQINALDRNQPFLIYCAVGGRSAKAAAHMQALGFKKVYELQGGYNNWAD